MSFLFSNGYTATLMLILGFGFLIFVHELGHFLVAKWVGIRATQFAVGFGQAMLAYRKGIGFKVGSTEPEYRRRTENKLSELGHNPTQVAEKKFFETADELGLGETEYRLNWLPLGGYVKMLGQEDMDPNAMSDDPRAFNRKPIWARASVISAGVIVNLIVGLLFLILAFSDFAGVNFPAPVVGQAVPGTPAATTYAEGHENDPAFLGLQPGDRVTHVHGKPIEDLVAVRIAAALGQADVAVPLTIQRRGIDQPLTYRITPVQDPRAEDMLSMGVLPANTLHIPEQIRGDFWTNSQWAKAGVVPGSTLRALNDQTLEQPIDLREALATSDGQPVELTFDNPQGQATTVAATPQADLPRTQDGLPQLLGFSPAATVREVTPGMPAEQAGLQPGDVLARVGSVPFPASVRDIIDELDATAGAPIAIDVIRDGEKIALGNVTPLNGKIGVGVNPGVDANVVRAAFPDSPAAALNLPPGSRILALNGQPIQSFNDLLRQLQATQTQNASPDQPLDIQLDVFLNVGQGSTETATLTLQPEHRAALQRVGWALPDLSVFFAPNEVRVAGSNVFEAASLGLEKTGEFVQQTYITLLRLIQGTVKPKNLRGPVGIVDAGVTMSERGWTYYIFFLGLISINLAVINFLPLPIVDGGLMVFLLIEKIRGKPAGVAVQNAAMIVGLLLIVSVFLVVTYHDIVRLLPGT